MKISTGLCLKLGLTETTELKIKKKRKSRGKNRLKWEHNNKKNVTMNKPLKEWREKSKLKRE